MNMIAQLIVAQISCCASKVADLNQAIFVDPNDVKIVILNFLECWCNQCGRYISPNF